MNVLNAVTL